MECVRVYEIPACKMVSSQCGMFGDGKLEAFNEWMSSLPRTMFPKDFLWNDSKRGGFVWYYIHNDEMNIPEDFELVDFPGGLYAVASDVDGKDNSETMNAIMKFIADKEYFEVDTSREYLGNVITPPSVGRVMEYNQMDYYVPIRIIAPDIP